MTDAPLKIEFAVPNFFAIPMKQVEIETPAQADRTYFIFRGKIVAVGVRRLDALRQDSVY